MMRSPVLFAACAALGLVSFLAADAGGDPGSGKRSLGPRTIAPPAPVWIVASYDSAGAPNMMTASWAGICCSRPPCVAVSLREATYTYHCVMAREAFTVNIPSVDHAAVAAYVGTVSGRDTDKFADTGLTPVRSDLVDAPYLGECPLVLECRLVRTVELGLHTMFIGEIVDVKADESILGDNGLPDPARHRPFVFSVGGYGFYEVGGPIGAVPELAKRYMDPE